MKKAIILLVSASLFISCQKEETTEPDYSCYVIGTSVYSASDPSANLHSAFFSRTLNPQDAEYKYFKTKKELDAFVATFKGCKVSVTEQYIK